MPWVRHVQAREATPLLLPGAYLSRGNSGKLLTRAIATGGWVWEETYPAFNAKSLAGRAFLAQIARCWAEGEIFDLGHPDYATPLGAGGGTPLVNGANQAGANLITDGWPASTLVLRAGDFFKIAGLNGMRQNRADATTNGTGQVTLGILPIILAGASPADNAVLTVTGVLFRTALVGIPDLSRIDVSGYVTGLTLAFQEAV